MISEIAYIVSVAAVVLQAYVVVYCVATRTFRRNISVNLFVLLVAITVVADYATAFRFGSHSRAYRAVFYGTDCADSVLAYFVIMSFYERVLRQLGVGRQIRRFAMMLLAFTAAFSYIELYQHRAITSLAFAHELEQNLNFVGVVLIYILWAIMLKLRETSTRLIQLVLAFGVYFSGTAGLYALLNLFPGLQGVHLLLIPELMSAFLPLAWAYTFTFVPEDARMAPRTVAAGAAA